MALDPDKEQAKRIAAAVNTADSSQMEQVLFDLIDKEKPSIDTLALACGLLQPSVPNANWHEQKRLALTAPLQVLVTKAQIEAQDRLSIAADQLARRNYWVALASMLVALVSLVVTLVK